jgi:2-hydroxychromene-2-carboxylate isomerase
MAPLLRIADSLDRGHDQKVADVLSFSGNGGASLLVQAGDDADLELWAANQDDAAFREVYAMPLIVQRPKIQSRTV